MSPALLELDDPRRGRLVVRSGETVVLLGPSGAGKTALIRALLGLEPGPEPVLAVRGRPAPARALAALVGWVPEGDGVFLSDTVWDNVARPPAVPPNDPDLARDALDLVGLAARAAEPVANLPRQGRRRVALARALASRRPLLIVDGELDPALWTLFPGVLEQAPGVEAVLLATATAGSGRGRPTAWPWWRTGAWWPRPRWPSCSTPPIPTCGPCSPGWPRRRRDPQCRMALTVIASDANDRPIR